MRAGSTFILLLFLFALGGEALKADGTEAYAVLVSATAQESPPKITLSWEQDPFWNANPSYTVYRKAAGAASWGTGTNLGNVLTYVDTGVTVGSAYEYQIVKTTSLGYSGYGYIYAGIKASTVPDSRGKVILVVDNTFTISLAAELARLEQDLAGDGWTVIRHDVVRDDDSIPISGENLGFGSATNQANAAGIRNTIIADYNADPTNVKAVLLFGRIPIFRSGNNNVDGHLSRPMPADGFYGEMHGTWTTATNSLPSDVDLQVGRVDLSRMPGDVDWNGPATFPSELELLRQYLNKDHNFRHGLIDAQRRGIVGEGFGSRNGQAFGASGWRNFAPFFGAANITRAPISTTPGSWQELICDSANTGASFLWAEGDGAGSVTSMGGLGTHGQYLDVWTRDLVGVDVNGAQTPDIKAVFTIFFGSWLGEWDKKDNIMRGVLASRTMGLTSSWSGYPHHYYHHMGLGETVGYGIRVSQNNDNTLYKNQVQSRTRLIHIALMGDPTLRMHPVQPVTSLTASGSGTVTLNWTASSDTALQGYHVYRSAGPNGPFARLNASVIAGTTYPDTPPAGTHTYMVRAVKLETSSGTYLNMSQGAFVTASTAGGGAGNVAPTVSAGPDRTGTMPGSAALSGSVSDDGLPNPPAVVTKTWSKVSGPGTVYFTDANAPETLASFSTFGTYTLRLTGNDGALVSTDDMVVTVSPASNNQAPVVDAGADQTITLPASASLSGSVTDDGLPNPTTTKTWSKVSGPGTVTFGTPTATETTASFSTSGVHTLRLTADDGALTGSDDVVVTVNPVSGNGSELPVDSNTIALYRFNGNYSDSSGNGYHLTVAGNVTRTDSPSGEAARFSNLGDKLTVSIPDSAILPGPTASPISIEARIYIRSYKTDWNTVHAALIDLYQDYDADLVLWDSMYNSPSGPTVLGPSGKVVVTSSQWNTVSKNVWHTLLITFDTSAMVTCYLDGTQLGSSVSAPANYGRSSNWTLTLGNFDGDVDEVRISDVVRSASIGSSFSSWATDYFSETELQDQEVSGWDADPDGDGMPNFLEYALGLDPQTPSSGGTAVTTEAVGESTYLQLQYTGPANPGDLLYEPQVSSDLVEWTNDVVEVERIANSDQTETVSVRDSVPIEDAPRRFIGLKITYTGMD